MVGLDQVFLRVSEDVGVVELCVNVSLPETDCPIPFPFEVKLSTHDGSAGTVTRYTYTHLHRHTPIIHFMQ